LRFRQPHPHCQIDEGPGRHLERAKEIHRGGKLRHHQVIDRPVLAAGWLDSDLADQDRAADALDASDQAGVDMEGVLVDDQIGPKVLDLREQDAFGLGVEPRAKPDLSGHWPQQRLEWRHRALQPCGKPAGRGSAGRIRRFDRYAVLTRPGRLQPWIVDVDLRRGMT